MPRKLAVFSDSRFSQASNLSHVVVVKQQALSAPPPGQRFEILHFYIVRFSLGEEDDAPKTVIQTPNQKKINPHTVPTRLNSSSSVLICFVRMESQFHQFLGISITSPSRHTSHHIVYISNSAPIWGCCSTLNFMRDFPLYFALLRALFHFCTIIIISFISM